MKVNVKDLAPVVTHEGARAVRINAEQQLRRSVMACLLWEDSFYESGASIADRITSGVAAVAPVVAREVAVEARTRMKLRHVPLLIVRAMARLPLHRLHVAATMAEVIQRPDEITEFLAIYWKEKRQPLSAQVKKGIARAFPKFDEYALAKYDGGSAKVTLRDALFLSHAKPRDELQAALWKRLVDGTMKTPDTWEVALSGGADKRETFERLMAEKKLGALAFLRNLRNMKEAGVGMENVYAYGAAVDLSRVLPFRFIAAARAVPAWEPIIESMMLRALSSTEKLPGKTCVVVDNSGSMYGAKVSARSEIDRSDAACALAILLREICEQCVVIGFGSESAVIPARRGFALRDAIRNGPGGGTMTATALTLAEREGYDRVIVVTDEQSHQSIPAPKGVGYFINVATYQNGIGYGAWTHIDGWSEAVVDYIRTAEAAR